MTSSHSVLYVHFNGRMIYGENGVVYEGNDVKFIQVNNDITFFELKRRLITALQLANQARRHKNHLSVSLSDDFPSCQLYSLITICFDLTILS
jgi:predicted ribosome-associated RNA-binding protein Tma20